MFYDLRGGRNVADIVWGLALEGNQLGFPIKAGSDRHVFCGMSADTGDHRLMLARRVSVPQLEMGQVVGLEHEVPFSEDLGVTLEELADGVIFFIRSLRFSNWLLGSRFCPIKHGVLGLNFLILFLKPLREVVTSYLVLIFGLHELTESALVGDAYLESLGALILPGWFSHRRRLGVRFYVAFFILRKSDHSFAIFVI